MMNKVLAEIEIPVAQKVIEVFLPPHLTGFEVLPLVIKIASELTDDIFMASDETTLFRKDDGSILDLNMPVWKLDIKNGDRLVLI